MNLEIAFAKWNKFYPSTFSYWEIYMLLIGVVLEAFCKCSCCFCVSCAHCRVDTHCCLHSLVACIQSCGAIYTLYRVTASSSVFLMHCRGAPHGHPHSLVALIPSCGGLVPGRWILYHTLHCTVFTDRTGNAIAVQSLKYLKPCDITSVSHHQLGINSWSVQLIVGCQF